MRVVDTMEHDFVCGRLRAQEWETTREEWLSGRADQLQDFAL
jgi:hypothetical protein